MIPFWVRQPQQAAHGRGERQLLVVHDPVDRRPALSTAETVEPVFVYVERGGFFDMKRAERHHVRALALYLDRCRQQHAAIDRTSRFDLGWVK
jgi:hypothetical protein